MTRSREAVALLVVALAMPLFTSSPYVLDTASGCLLLLACVASWEVHAIPTRDASFGHSLFVGGAAYLSAWLSTRGGLPPAAAAAIATGATAIAAALLGAAASGERGASFALVTMACALMLQQSAWVFPTVFGGEEGILGVPAFADGPRGRYLTAWCATAVVFGAAAWAGAGVFGMRLRAAGSDEVQARASGIPARRVRAAAFALSGLLGGLAGVAMVHTRFQANPEMLAGTLSIRIALLGLLAAGRWTIPVVLGSFFLRETLSGATRYEGVLYATALLAGTVLLPRWASRTSRGERS